jgi:hypothetical protein
MYTSLVLSTALLAPAAPIPHDTQTAPVGPAPKVLSLKADQTGTVRIQGTIPVKQTVTYMNFVIENNQQVQKPVEQDVLTSQYVSKTLEEFKGTFATADGKPLTALEATNRVKAGAPLLASSDGKPISKVWLRSVSSDTIVMVADGFSHLQPSFAQGTFFPATPAPRLAILGTDATGNVMIEANSTPQNANGAVYYGDDIEWGGRGRGFGGRKVGMAYYPGPQNVTGTIVTKKLADVQYDAYDVTGKMISKSEATKRLAAGGMVLVAGDARMPDDAYLKNFNSEIMILVSSELVLPVTPIDQTKKKTPANDKDKKAEPANPAVDQLIPAVPQPVGRPAIIRQRAIQIEKN